MSVRQLLKAFTGSLNALRAEAILTVQRDAPAGQDFYLFYHITAMTSHKINIHAHTVGLNILVHDFLPPQFEIMRAVLPLVGCFPLCSKTGPCVIEPVERSSNLGAIP